MGNAVHVAVRAENYTYDKPYSYSLPSELSDKISAGMRVLVPFGRGNRPVQALVLDVYSEENPVNLKRVIEPLDETPVVSDKDLRLILWMRDKYFCTCYDALKACIPAGLDYKQQIDYKVNPDYSGSPLPERSKAAALLEYMKKAGGQADFDTLCRELGEEEARTALNALVKKGILLSEFHKIRGVSDKSVKYAVLTGEVPQVKLGKRQAEVVSYLESAGESSVKEISYYTGASAQTINALRRLGIIDVFEREVLRLTFDRKKPSKLLPDPELVGEQEEAYRELLRQAESGKPSAALLYGVTGSGKTFIYIKLIRDMIRSGRKAIVLVPEIALTPQLLSRFYDYFGDRVALIHSALSVGERYDEWKRIKSGNADVVIGTRSAVFAPLENIVLIIIDEEQEYTYKSEQNPRYHARDIAKFRAVQHGAMLLQGSATPSLESMYAAKSGKYSIYTLKNRYNGDNLPAVLFADMSAELRAGNGGQISGLLKDEIKKNLSSGEQTILFINRRGSSRYILCQNCGGVPKCPNCSVAMTYHSANNRLMCHYCGHSEKMIEVCPACASRHITMQGAGTQRVAEELEALFPGAGVIRMDADTIVGKQTHESLLSRFRDERVPILLGTQMITKGLDFENVTLVGVIDADQSLNIPDFRAAERTFSLITQVVGRAGRGEKKGRAVIQTYSPENPVLLCAARQDYDSFYAGEIEFRESFNYPPFCDLLCMTLSGAENSKVYAAASHIRDALASAKSGGDEVFEPAPAPVFKVNNKLRYRVIMKTEDTKRLRNAVSLIVRRFMSDRRFAGVSLAAVFNPLE